MEQKDLWFRMEISRVGKHEMFRNPVITFFIVCDILYFMVGH